MQGVFFLSGLPRLCEAVAKRYERTRQFRATTRSARAISRHRGCFQNTFELCTMNTAMAIFNKTSASLHKWSHKIIYLISLVILYILVVNVFTPEHILVTFTTSCSDNGCEATLEKNTAEKIYVSKPTLVFDSAERISQFSNIPFSSFIRLIPRVKNTSTFVVSVTNPPLDKIIEATVVCDFPSTAEREYPYNSQLPFNEKISVSNKDESLKNITDSLLTCDRIQTPKNITVTVGPNEYVSFKNMDMSYDISYETDLMSKILILIALFILSLVLLPGLRELTFFLSKGWTYFRK
jgi:hypothetical protein